MPDCAVCSSALIPGLTDCINCGEPVEQPIALVVDGAVVSDPIADDARQIAVQQIRRLREAEALEHASVEDAIAVYELLIAERCPYTPPYARLCVLYRRLKRPADEERVLRAALAMGWPDLANSWFVTRLARVLARKR